jgi:hypothetical protein
MVVEAGCVGPSQIEFRTTVISLDGKRFFEFGFYGPDLSELVGAVVKSLKPVTATPAATASPQK